MRGFPCYIYQLHEKYHHYGLSSKLVDHEENIGILEEDTGGGGGRGGGGG